MDDATGDPETTRPGEPETGDAFGELLRAHRDHGDSYAVIERDDGYVAPSGGGELYFAPPAEWPEIERRALDRVEGRVLDVGCGAGRHALSLQERGHDVTGIDLSAGAVDVARDRGVEDVRELDVADVADEFAPGTFDSVIMLGNNFGLVGTADRAPGILRGLADVATDDATLVAQTRDPTATDDQHHLEYHEYNRERGRLPGALRMRVRYGTLATPWYDYLMAQSETMVDLASETPWALVETLDPGESVGSTGGDYVGILHVEE